MTVARQIDGMIRGIAQHAYEASADDRVVLPANRHDQGVRVRPTALLARNVPRELIVAVMQRIGR
eukprot:6179565-Pleurochrysis_carterae.AAC.1